MFPSFGTTPLPHFLSPPQIPCLLYYLEIISKPMYFLFPLNYGALKLPSYRINHVYRNKKLLLSDEYKRWLSWVLSWTADFAEWERKLSSESSLEASGATCGQLRSWRVFSSFSCLKRCLFAMFTKKVRGEGRDCLTLDCHTLDKVVNKKSPKYGLLDHRGLHRVSEWRARGV